MPKLITIETFSDNRGHLSVLEKNMPFDIKRVFYITQLHYLGNLLYFYLISNLFFIQKIQIHLQNWFKL